MDDAAPLLFKGAGLNQDLEGGFDSDAGHSFSELHNSSKG
jgi:hypothetical protein